MTDLVPFGQFSDPIVGGQSTLIRDAIRSRNYVTGVSGWSINKDGTAEFNGVTIRGTGVFGDPDGERVEIDNAGNILIYNAANELIVSLDSDGLFIADPDTGAYIDATVAAGVTILALQPPDVAGYVFSPALVYGDSDAGRGDAWMLLESPEIDGGDTARIYMFGDNPPFTQLIHLECDNVTVGDGINSIGWGPVARAFSAADSAAVTAETTVLTSTVYDYVPGRAYRATCGPLVSSSNTNAGARFRIRKNNAAGQLLGLGGDCPNSAVATQLCNGESTFYFGNFTGAVINCFIALTLQNMSGGANTSQQRVSGGLNRWLLIEDCGDTTAFDWATPLV